VRKLQPEFTLARLYGPETLLSEDELAELADYWDDNESFEQNVAAAQGWLQGDNSLPRT
jgi:hypothetical protein